MPIKPANIIQSGQLLTRQAQDIKGRLHIILWVKTESGVSQLVIEDQQATFFVESEMIEQAKGLLVNMAVPMASCQAVPLKTFNQKSVFACYFSSLQHFYRGREILKNEGIKCYEDDIRPDDRYLMERFITADLSFIGDSEHCDSYSKLQQVRCKKAAEQVKLPLKTLSLDIECSMAGELYSIGLYALAEHGHKEFSQVIMIGAEQANAPNYIHWVENEKLLLKQLLAVVKQFDPDVFIGWNVINFDFRLLQKRFDKYGLDFSVGRDNSTVRWRQNSNANEQFFLDIAGRLVLDGIDVLKTATYHFASFSLDFVAQALLGKKKKVTDVDNRVKEITDNFHHNKQALAAYNLEDCRLVSLIFDKEQLLEFALLRASLTGLTIDRVGGSVAAFTNLYLPKLHRSGYVAPNMGDSTSDLVSPGGHVMDSLPGLYNNVLVLDFKSLYPSIIRTFKIDPMGLIEGGRLKEEQALASQIIPAFDGAYFSREAHFLPDIITSLWQERDKAKQQNNAPLSQAIKIIMNSFYGVLGSTGCRFFDPRLSGAITKRGHEILKTTKVWIEQQGYRVIYGDTDSIFVYLDKTLAKPECLTLGKKLEAYINERWQTALQQEYQLDCHLEIEFETHFSKFLMPTIRGLDIAKAGKSVGTKKRYAGLVDDKVIFKGMETVRSDWTEIAKTFQQQLYVLIFNGQPYKDYLLSLLAQIRAGKHDEHLVFSKKIRRNLQDYKNTPPHIKACIIANKTLGKNHYKRGSQINYVITINGVQPLEMLTSPLDYDYYIDKQIKPIANDILPFLQTSFEQLTNSQQELF